MREKILQLSPNENYTHNSTVVLTRTNQFDNLNRLTNLWWTAGSTIIASYAYQYNTANQRTRVTLVDGSYWLYGYDYLGQVISARHYWADGTLVAGEQFEFTFDDIGNRIATRAGGDPYGRFLRNANYTNNSLNQITSRDVPGYLEMLGSANPSATVTLWSPAGRLSTPTGNYSPSTRHADFFWGELTPNNTTGAVWIAVTNLAVLQNGTSSDLETTNVGNIFVPKTPETFSYDADGNMTSDGRFTVAWDAENRAISFTSLTNAPDGSKVKVDCAYDDRGRRIQKVVSAWSGSNYVAQSTNRFVYDGWNLIGILNSTNGLLYSFTWGTDLSGTMQGAGGVGGLISMTVHSGTSAGTYFYVFDGNGNVVALVNAGDGSIAAQCEYGPFGELLRATGPMAKTNPFRFSTKYEDDETDLLYYGRRYYTASTGRWLDRDPLMEAGGKNLYAFVLNAPVSFYDPFGLEMPVWEGPMFQPPPAPPPAPTNAPTLPDAMRACCDEKSRQKGENELNRRYNRAVAKAGVLNLLPAALGKPGASCVNSSSDILRWLAPFPKCWVCYLENRDRVDYNILRHDHQVVVCRGYTSASTAPREIMFDWWGDTENTLSRSGGSPDPFRQEYPLGPWVTPERYTGAITDCSGNPIDPRLHQDCSFGACLAGLRGQ